MVVMSGDPDLQLRGRLLRRLGLLREMLPGSFVEHKRACGRPNCHCADGKNLHTQYQISVLIDGKPKTFHIPKALVDQVRQKIQFGSALKLRLPRFCRINLCRFLKKNGKVIASRRHRFEA
jgi:hypothetical protein